MSIRCDDCDLKPYCIARLNDRTVVGCGIPLWYYGLIKLDEVRVVHEIKTKEEESK